MPRGLSAVSHLLAPAVGLSRASAVFCFLFAYIANASDARQYEFDIPRQNAESAVNEIAMQAGVLLLFAYDEVKPVVANPVRGAHTVADALAILLEDTGLSGTVTDGGVITVSSGSGNGKTGRNGLPAVSRATFPSMFYAADRDTAAGGDSDGRVTLLEEVVVTASRRRESLQDVANAVTVIDPRQSARSGLTTLTEILPFVPGVFVQDDGASFGSDVYIRGINAVGAAGVVSYIDDISYGSSTIYAGPGAPIDGTLLDLESISILKGPQGTLYGASAMGGLIQFATRDASLEKWTEAFSPDLSLTDGGGLNQLYRLSVNGPLVENAVGLSFTGFWEDKTGYVDNVVVPTKHWDDYEYYGGSASILLAPTDELSVKALVLYQKSAQEGRAAVDTDDEGVPVHGWYTSGASNVVPSLFETRVFGLTVDYDFGPLTLRSVTSFQDKHYNETIDATVPFADLADDLFPENAPHTSAVYLGRFGWDKFTQELRLTSVSNQQLEWLIGGYHSTESGFNFLNLVTTPHEPLLSVDVPSEYEQTSIFGTVTYYFTPSLDGSIGIRYSENESSVSLNDGGSVLVAGFPLNSVGEGVTTYLINMRYRATDNVSMYARAANGFRPGGANFIVRDPETGSAMTEPFYRADSLWSYDLGVKGTLYDGRIAYDIGAFYIDWRDYQIRVNQRSFNVVDNASKASSRGGEITLDVTATDALAFRGALAYVDAKLDADEPALGGAKGAQLPNSPRWSGSLGVNYDFTAAGMPAYLGASWQYTGDTPIGFEGFTDRDGVFYPPGAPRYVLPHHHVVNLHAGLAAERFDVSLYVTNLLNEKAWTNFQTSSSGIGAGRPLRPRTVGLVMSTRF